MRLPSPKLINSVSKAYIMSGVANGVGSDMGGSDFRFLTVTLHYFSTYSKDE